MDRLLSRLKPDDLSIAGCILAVEVNRLSLQIFRERTSAFLLDRAWSPRAIAKLLDQWLVYDDFLSIPLDSIFSHIVGNPPYIRLENLPKDLLKAYRARSTLTSVSRVNGMLWWIGTSRRDDKVPARRHLKRRLRRACFASCQGSPDPPCSDSLPVTRHSPLRFYDPIGCQTVLYSTKLAMAWSDWVVCQSMGDSEGRVWTRLTLSAAAVWRSLRSSAFTTALMPRMCS